MKKYLTLFLLAILSNSGITQTTTNKFLDMNNVNATISDVGVFFNNPAAQQPGYNVPNNSLLNLIYGLSFWYGGVDLNGQLKLSAQMYTPFGDHFEGPLTIDGTATPDTSGAWDISVFEVYQFEIDQHILNYTNVGYTPAPNIANWPGNGDVANGFANDLAPYIDVDNDGIYDAMAGDYPCIRGDHAIYVIMNDKADVHISGGDPIGIEMHYMFYEYVSTDAINNTTFIHGKVINRGTQTLQDFKVSTFMDGDVGNYADDYFGSDSTRNLMYFYNGDNFDETGPGVPYSYMEDPPAVGIFSLTHDIESIGLVDGGAANAIDFWNAMNAQDLSGAPWITPSTMTPTNFQFASDPSSSTDPDSEVSLANAPGDRRGVATINFGGLAPNEVHSFDYAVIYNRDTVDNVDNASGLLDVADFVQDFFDTTVVNECLNNAVNVTELETIDFLIYPNPSNGTFTIQLESNFSNGQLEICDLSGRVVLNRLELTSTETQLELNQPSGVYLLHLTIDGKRTTKRIILE